MRVRTYLCFHEDGSFYQVEQSSLDISSDLCIEQEGEVDIENYEYSLVDGKVVSRLRPILPSASIDPLLATGNIVEGRPVLDYDDDYYWNMLRSQRKHFLKESDWTQVPDAPVDHSAWTIYRQALRDLPANTEDPRNPQWPTPPQ